MACWGPEPTYWIDGFARPAAYQLWGRMLPDCTDIWKLTEWDCESQELKWNSFKWELEHLHMFLGHSHQQGTLASYIQPMMVPLLGGARVGVCPQQLAPPASWPSLSSAEMPTDAFLCFLGLWKYHVTPNQRCLRWRGSSQRVPHYSGLPARSQVGKWPARQTCIAW